MLIEICIRRLGYIATNDDGQELPARRCVLLSSELPLIDSTTIHRLKTSARSSSASRARSTAPRISHSDASCWYSSAENLRQHVDRHSVLHGQASERMTGAMCSQVLGNIANVGNLFQIGIHLLITRNRK